MSILRNRGLLPFLVAVTAVFACGDGTSHDPVAPPLEGPSPDRVDATTDGHPHFYFLPPLARRVVYPGKFQPDAIGDLDVRLKLSGAAAATDLTIVQNRNLEHYEARWPAPSDATEAKVSVWLSGKLLGWMDLKAAVTKDDVREARAGGYAPFEPGRIARIRFRVEVGAGEGVPEGPRMRDRRTEGADPRLLLLPPTTRTRVDTRSFDPDALDGLRVEVWRMMQGSPAELIKHFEAKNPNRADQVRMNRNQQFYQAIWPTAGVGPWLDHRALILLGGVELGWVDIDIVPSEDTESFDRARRSNAYAVYAGKQATIRFRIELSTDPTSCTLSSTPDTDGDRLPDCAETNTGIYVSPLDSGTDPNNSDTDGDRLNDGDEVLGTRGGLDLPGLGVSPLVPSVLIEYDWFNDSGHSHRPTRTQINMVTASFAAQGIEVIHDYGQGPAPFNRGNFIADADGNVDGFGAEFQAYKRANFDANRDGYFHYNLHPHRYNNGGSSGLAELFGDDFITATHNFYTRDLAVAGTIQHELGHNLGLHHGGRESVNYKPNYNSVMSYLYQFGGVDNNCTPPGDGVLDYSHGLNTRLVESRLNETIGICGGVPWDWNRDGDATDNPVSADINRDRRLSTLDDYDDWSHLYYGGIGDADGAASKAVTPREVVTCQEVPEDFR